LPRGQHPKPTALQILEGDPRRYGVHKIEAQAAREPKPADGLPKCPESLKGYARGAAGNWVVVGLMTHPAVPQRNQAMMILKAFCDEFDLTPAAPARRGLGCVSRCGWRRPWRS
jgi:hypothetical protein